ncbi:MAG TPA: hypothetical protein PK513_07620 [Alphaproteobacteria bacterium]|nr:hypothetical protein [Alphaproteobacteria bacterium]USO05816.1 MAG: hypothetical protein H6859_01025 [Rhodospirillales bacterium]HOO82353.1 hypothetical protein [Alphaproteobacteria bacterium]
MADDGTGKVRYTGLVSGNKLAEMFQRGKSTAASQVGDELVGEAPGSVAFDQVGIVYDDPASTL